MVFVEPPHHVAGGIHRMSHPRYVDTHLLKEFVWYDVLSGCDGLRVVLDSLSPTHILNDSDQLPGVWLARDDAGRVGEPLTCYMGVVRSVLAYPSCDPAGGFLRR